MRSYTGLAEIGQVPLTDREYLEELILQLYRFQSNQICEVKDTSSAVVAITPVFAQMLGFDKLDKILGKKDEEMNCKTAEFADEFYRLDREVERTKETKHMLSILEYTTGLAILKTIKGPIINLATGNVLGTFDHSVEFSMNSTLKTILNMHGKQFGTTKPSLNISDNVKEFDLTKRELEVLFCICLGLSDRKSIARFLSFVYNKDINPDTTVKDAVKNLYNKLPCNSMSMLAEYAISQRLHLRIPKSFIKKGSFEIAQEIPVVS